MVKPEVERLESEAILGVAPAVMAAVQVLAATAGMEVTVCNLVRVRTT